MTRDVREKGSRRRSESRDARRRSDRSVPKKGKGRKSSRDRSRSRSKSRRRSRSRSFSARKGRKQAWSRSRSWSWSRSRGRGRGRGRGKSRGKSRSRSHSRSGSRSGSRSRSCSRSRQKARRATPRSRGGGTSGGGSGRQREASKPAPKPASKKESAEAASSAATAAQTATTSGAAVSGAADGVAGSETNATAAAMPAADTPASSGASADTKSGEEAAIAETGPPKASEDKPKRRTGWDVVGDPPTPTPAVSTAASPAVGAPVAATASSAAVAEALAAAGTPVAPALTGAAATPMSPDSAAPGASASTPPLVAAAVALVAAAAASQQPGAAGATGQPLGAAGTQPAPLSSASPATQSLAHQTLEHEIQRHQQQQQLQQLQQLQQQQPQQQQPQNPHEQQRQQNAKQLLLQMLQQHQQQQQQPQAPQQQQQAALAAALSSLNALSNRQLRGPAPPNTTNIVPFHAQPQPQQLQQLAPGLAQVSENELQLEQNRVGFLIGKSGETLKGIQSLSGTNIQIDQSTKHLGSSILRIAGPPQGVVVAKELIVRKMKEAPHGQGSPASLQGPAQQLQIAPSPTTPAALLDAGGLGGVAAEYHVDQSIVGFFLGRGGEQVKRMKTQSGATINVDQNSKDLGYSIVRIMRGPGVNLAKKLVESRILQAKEATLQNMSNGEAEELIIQQHLVGWVIGKSGETLRALKDQSGATVVLMQDTRDQGYSVMRFGGTPEQVAIAKNMLTEKIAEAGDKKPPGLGDLPRPAGPLQGEGSSQQRQMPEQLLLRLLPHLLNGQQSPQGEQGTQDAQQKPLDHQQWTPPPQLPPPSQPDSEGFPMLSSPGMEDAPSPLPMTTTQFDAVTDCGGSVGCGGGCVSGSVFGDNGTAAYTAPCGSTDITSGLTPSLKLPPSTSLETANVGHWSSAPGVGVTQRPPLSTFSPVPPSNVSMLATEPSFLPSQQAGCGPGPGFAPVAPAVAPLPLMEQAPPLALEQAFPGGGTGTGESLQFDTVSSPVIGLDGASLDFSAGTMPSSGLSGAGSVLVGPGLPSAFPNSSMTLPQGLGSPVPQFGCGVSPVEATVTTPDLAATPQSALQSVVRPRGPPTTAQFQPQPFASGLTSGMQFAGTMPQAGIAEVASSGQTHLNDFGSSLQTMAPTLGTSGLSLTTTALSQPWTPSVGDSAGAM
eukprot:TRINITY_DN10343_c0_g2_i5.p1 TRINITY_DN10343_c0_g2~~TRINITY_DN10343_c0_g2_i5.p1  ORF type:complete len:1172 (-),score=255.67 TRINITY_DN10343_c0_g2_i5:191-3706(-)